MKRRKEGLIKLSYVLWPVLSIFRNGFLIHHLGLWFSLGFVLFPRKQSVYTISDVTSLNVVDTSFLPTVFRESQSRVHSTHFRKCVLRRCRYPLTNVSYSNPFIHLYDSYYPRSRVTISVPFRSYFRHYDLSLIFVTIFENQKLDIYQCIYLDLNLHTHIGSLICMI